MNAFEILGGLLESKNPLGDIDKLFDRISKLPNNEKDKFILELFSEFLCSSNEKFIGTFDVFCEEMFREYHSILDKDRLIFLFEQELTSKENFKEIFSEEPMKGIVYDKYLCFYKKTIYELKKL